MSYTELEAKIENYFAERCGDRLTKLSVAVNFDLQNSKCTIHLEKMYEGISEYTSFKDLTWISNLLGTDEINLENKYFASGCESCDYGSCDEINIVCFNIKVND